MTAVSKLFERGTLRKLVDGLEPPVRNRAISALDGFDRADRLLETEQVIASFSAINAQEEAATALMRALQLRNYPGSDRLELWNHAHKAAIYPLVDAVRLHVTQSFEGKAFQVSARFTPPELIVKVPLTAFGVTNPALAHLAVQPVHPLGMLSSVDGRPHDFKGEFEEITKAGTRNKVLRYIRRLANQRNKLLYASDNSAPISRAKAADLAQRRQAAELILYITVMILQTADHQLMVVQALHALLVLLDRSDGLVITKSRKARGCKPSPASASDDFSSSCNRRPNPFPAWADVVIGTF